MCGIAGFISHRSGGPQLQAIAAQMNECLRHRGPDDIGAWTDPEAGVALAHRRLSVVDLSAAGHQPMVSASGRFVIIYNGEVYSHEEIRPSLTERGIAFRGHSDTEVILESVEAFGIEPTLSRLIGMFAIALWDRRERTLTLVRDRLGIKPLYWAKFGDLFVFGSELKALRVHPGWTPRIDRAAVASYMRHGYIPAPRTIYEGVFKLEPGTVLSLPFQGEPRISRYWDPRAVARAGLASPVHGSDTAMTDQLEALLLDAVKRRMIADVPLGAFLSGGIDSSTVVALMKAANAGPVKTYTIGFDNDDYDEAPAAAAVARHLGTEHTELTATSQQALDLIPQLPEWYDEPFADSSQIPTCLVSAMTRRHVTVALSGDGGDELFAGYNRHQWAAGSWSSLSMLPQAIRSGMAAALTNVSTDGWSRALAFLPDAVRPAQVGDKIHKLASVLALPDGDAAYRALVTQWDPAAAVPGVAEHKGVLWDSSLADEMPDLLSRMQFLDLVTYLPDDILTKLDRATMSVALEGRVPLIDHRVVEFAWRLPRRMKIRGGTSKWLLRQVLHRHVPAELVTRPKRGFAIPLAEWLRGPLRDWAEGLLSEQRLREAGLLDAGVVRQRWQEHLSGRRNWEQPLWTALMLESWRTRWG